MLQRLQRKRADPCAMVRAWFAACLVARVGASGAAASYLTQRLADFGLEMGDFPGTGRGVRTVRKRARGERVVAWYDAEVVFAERALERRPELAATLLGAATAEGAAALGVDAGALAPGNWADFALLDLDAPALAGAEDVLGAAIFGGSAEGLVLDTCVAGRWTKGGYA